MSLSTSLSDQLESYLDLSSAELKMTAGNMANVSTPGYTEETVQWQETSPLNINGMIVGTGVADTGALSQRDRVLNQAVDQQTQAQAASGARLIALDNLQATFAAATSTSNTTGASASITSGLSNFFGSLQQLQASPSDSSLREAVLSAANALTDSFHSAASSLEQQQSSLNGEVSANVSEVNSLSTAIAGLNQQIQSLSPNADAGQLEDQRQYDLQSLSKLVGIQQVTTERNGMTVTTTGGSVLVLGNQAVPLTTSVSGGVAHVSDGTADITAQLASGEGEIGGLLQARDSDITNALRSLDTLANAIGTAVNTANEGGSDANGNAGGALFSLPSGVAGSATAMSVLITDPAKVAAAASGAGIGDGTNAGVMAALAQQTIVSGQDPSDYLAGFVSSLGDLTENVTTNNTAQQAALTQLQNQQSNLSTVSLDTEATNLQNLEQAYQAASKVFAILNTLIGSAINLGTETTV